MRDELQLQNTRPVEMYQVAIAFFMLLSVVIATAVSINNRITALEVKQNNDDMFRIEMKSYFDKLNSGQTEILIKLENKENRSSLK
jgi:hypothetical protein